VNKILCSFRNVNCSTKTRLVKSYCTGFYGAETWNLSHNGLEEQGHQENMAAAQHYSFSTHSVLFVT